MILVFDDVLTPAAASELCVKLDTRQQLAPAERAASFAANVSELVLAALGAHPLFVLGTRPARMAAARFDVRGRGAASGWSVDEAIASAAGERRGAGAEQRVRADVAVTLFLSDPSSYDGGELCIDTGFGEERYKPAAGACLARPASARHRVEPVRSGKRWTAELWLQSLVRDPRQREILYDVACSEELLGLFADPEAALPELPGSEVAGSEVAGSELSGSELSGSELSGSELSGQKRDLRWGVELELLRRCHQNLLRLWAEP